MKIDKVKIENILKLLRRGKYELGGEEVLAFHQCFEYLVRLLQEIKKAEDEAKALASAKQVVPVIEQPPTPEKKKRKPKTEV